ncbi:MAG: DUF3426 domain-containing protein [Pseudomonadota bacterium]
MSDFVLICPQCDTRYKAQVSDFEPEGREVRCARCSFRWYVPAQRRAAAPTADADQLALQDNQQIDPVDPVPLTSPIEPAEPKVFGGSPGPASKTSKPQKPKLPRKPAAPTIGADVMMRDKADREKLAKRRRTIRIIWAIPLILVVLAAIIAWFNRQAIVNRIPQMASVYRMVGIEVRAGGLDIDPPEARTVLVDGAPVIRVASTVRNLTRREKTVPLIELSLHDVDGADLLQWYVETQPAQIEGRGTLGFETVITDPPTDAVSLRYRFSRDDGLTTNG